MSLGICCGRCMLCEFFFSGFIRYDNNLTFVGVFRPQEISTTVSEGDVTKLSNVVRMAHKYHYITTEAWALGVLLGRFSNQPVSSISTPILVQITEVAVLCEDKPLLDAVRMRWKGLIGKRKDLAVAINVMGRLGIRDLEGLAYYGMLFEGRGRWDSDPGLTRDQRIRLLSGYYNITKASETLTVTPPKFDHNPACDAEADCEEAWQNFWKAITALDSGDEVGSSVVSQMVVHDKMDLMGRLMMAVSLVTAFEAESSTGAYKVYHPGVDFEFRWSECIGAALSATMRMSKDTQQDLMSFFEDVV